MFIFTSQTGMNSETALKMDFIHNLKQLTKNSLLQELLISIEAKFAQFEIIFVDEDNPVSNSQSRIISIPLNLSVDEACYFLLKTLCLFDNEENLSIANFDSAIAYAEALLQWQYTATIRCTQICIDYFKQEGLEHDSRVEELCSSLKLSFEEYKAQKLLARLVYESDWLEVQKLESDLQEMKSDLTKLRINHSQSAREIMRVSSKVHENKIRIYTLEIEVRAIYHLLETKELQIPKSYLFAQQRDASCMLMPFMNLAILQAQKKNNGGLRLFDRSWRSKEEWFLATFSALQAWYAAMGRLSFPQEVEDHSFADYQNILLTQGLLKENISQLHTFDGSPYIDLRDLTSLKKLFFTPYTSSVEHKSNMVTKVLPLFSKEGRLYIFNPEGKRYTLVQKNIAAGALLVKNIDLSENLRAYYNLEPEMILLPDKPAFGFDASYRTSYLDRKSILLANQKIGYFYSVGLYQLMLLGLQLDRDNHLIIEGHPLFAVYLNFKKEMAASPVNPWNSPLYVKENLFEYHVAVILNEQPQLKVGIQKCISSYTAWPYYSQLGELVGGEEYKRYLPGENQMLAYAISQNLKHLWAISLATEKFAAVLDLKSLPEAVRNKLELETIIAEIREEAFRNIEGRSFISYWIELRACLLQRLGTEPDLVSFDGHGSVKSFSSKICSYQRQKGLADEDLYALLGYTEIDSFYNEGKQPFYQRSYAEEEQLSDAAKKIRAYWRFHKGLPEAEQSPCSSSMDTCTVTLDG